MQKWAVTFSKNGGEYTGWNKLKGERVYIDEANVKLLHVDDKIIEVDEYWIEVFEASMDELMESLKKVGFFMMYRLNYNAVVMRADIVDNGVLAYLETLPNGQHVVRFEFAEVFNKWGHAPYQGYLPSLSDNYLEDLLYDLKLLIKYKDVYLEDDWESFNEVNFRLTNY